MEGVGKVKYGEHYGRGGRMISEPPRAMTKSNTTPQVGEGRIHVHLSLDVLHVHVEDIVLMIQGKQGLEQRP